MVKQVKEEKKYLPLVMKQYDAVFSISLSDGFANISFNESGDGVVTFLNDEGYTAEDAEHKLEDVKKVAGFMEEMKNLRLQDFEAATK